MNLMVLGLQDRREIEEIISNTRCSKRFQCYTSGLQSLCRIMSYAEGQMIECMDRSGSPCEFRNAFGWGHACQCPVRKHIAQKFQR